MRWTLVSILATVGALVAAAPAVGGHPRRRRTPAFWSFDSSWRDQDVDLTGTRHAEPGRAGLGRHAHRRDSVHVAAARLGRPSTARTSGSSSAGDNEIRDEGVGRARRRRHAAGRPGAAARDDRAHDRHRRTPTATYTRRRRSTSRSRCRTRRGRPGRRRRRLPPGRRGHAAADPRRVAGGAHVTPKGSVVHPARRSGRRVDASSTASPAPRRGLTSPPVDRRRRSRPSPSRRARRRSPRPSRVPAVSLRTTALKAKGKRGEGRALVHGAPTATAR